MPLLEIRARMEALADPERARFLEAYFKTRQGEVFLGLRVPQVRALARDFCHLEIPRCFELLRSPVHEERLLALLLLVTRFKVADKAEQRMIYQGYLANIAFIDNWDLVDGSAPQIVGGCLADRSRKVLPRLAHSRNLWERRIAMLATLHFIRQEDFADALRIAALLLRDDEPLIHKACGWMLREVGNQNLAELRKFLEAHYGEMPRTMLRYSIERMDPAERSAWLRRS